MATQDGIRVEAYKYLNESNLSTLGQFPSGQGGSPVQAGDTYANGLILEGIADLCRSCVYYPGVATIQIATATNNKLITGSKIWFPTDVYIGSTRLIHTSEPSLRANDLTYKSVTTATSSFITHWYRADNYAVSIYPGNATGSDVNLTVHGASIPDNPVSTTSPITFLPDDLLTQLLASYVATRLVMKNIDDPSVAQRMFWKNWYDEGRMKLYARLDTHLRSPNGPFQYATSGTTGSEMNIAWGRLILLAIGAFTASAAPEFDAAWKAQHIPDNASFGMVTRVLLMCSIEGVRAGIPAMTTALIAFFMRQDSNLPVFSVKLPEVRRVSETTRDIDG